ncbi:hypothetical protein LINGRAHAP2_LOCUS12556 [Linum grandiflorum]
MTTTTPATSILLLIVVILKSECTTLPSPPNHLELQLLVQVQCVHPHESRVIPRRLGPRIDEVRHVQNSSAPPRSEEYLLLVSRVTLIEQPVDHHQGLKRHGPVTCPIEPPRERANARADVGARVGRQAQNLPDVSLLRRIHLMARGLHDRNLQVRQRAAVVVHLGQAYACLIFDRVNGASYLARSHMVRSFFRSFDLIELCCIYGLYLVHVGEGED